MGQDGTEGHGSRLGGGLDDRSARPVAEYAMGLRFQQQSAEVRALQLQAFQLAAERLDAAIAAAGGPAGLAVVSDLDETILDNSPLLVRDLAAGRSFDDWGSWGHWERAGVPALNAGAMAFLRHADAAGVAIFYLSDRFEENRTATLATLAALELPQAGPERVLLMGPPKADRRATIAATHRIVLQLGDTLHDFDPAFAGADLATQRRLVAEHAGRFGRDWIIVPNAGYGRWASAELSAWDAAYES